LPGVLVAEPVDVAAAELLDAAVAADLPHAVAVVDLPGVGPAAELLAAVAVAAAALHFD
jgi:hypothetical protein